MGELVRYERGSMVPVTDTPGRSMVPLADPPGRSMVPAREPGTSLAYPVPVPPYGQVRRRRPNRKAMMAAALAALVIVAVGAAAFADGHGTTGSHSAAAPADLAGPAAASASAGSAAFTLSVTADSPGIQSTLISGAGSIDLASHVDRMTASIPMVSSVLGGRTSATVVTDGNGVYLQVPALSVLTGGRSWLEASTSAADSSGSLALAALGDPSRLLGALGSVSGSVTKVGTPRLDGVNTTEYQSTVSLAGLVAGLAHHTQSGASASAAAEVADALGGPTVPVTVWVGADGRVHQLSVSLDLNQPTVSGALHSLDPSLLGSSRAGAGPDLTVTVGLSGYGAPVSVSVPPDAQVVNLTHAYSSVRGAVSRLGGGVKGLVDRV
jgi:hypothetical protein